MSATQNSIVPPSNLIQYVAYLEHANTFNEHQLTRAAARIRELEAQLARGRGHLVIGEVSA